MSYYVTGYYIVAAIGVVVGADASIKSSKAQQIALDEQAEDEKFTAESRELGRRQKLNKVLSANIVSQSSSGILGEGTPQSVALESAKQVGISEGVEGLSSRLKQAQLRRQGKAISSAGKVSAGSTLLSSASSIAQGV